MELQRQIDQLLARRASQWHLILETAGDAERAEFVAWLKQSPLHVKEYLEAAYTDRLVAHIDPAKTQDVDALLAEISTTVVPLRDQVRKGSATKSVWSWKLAAAAGIAVLAALAAVTYEWLQPQAFATDIGEQRTIQLSDESIVTMNADSLIQVRLDDSARDISLEHGEALFKVAHDAKRPFRVQTHAAIVEAVGTQFNVYERPEGTRVSVLEGRVKVQTAKDTQIFAAGEEAQVRADGLVRRSTPADVQNAVAWRERRLVFVDTPLEEMVREFNRYSRSMHLTLQGVPAGSHHYNGIFDATDPQSLADILAREPDLTLERKEREIVIRGKE